MYVGGRIAYYRRSHTGIVVHGSFRHVYEEMGAVPHMCLQATRAVRRVA